MEATCQAPHSISTMCGLNVLPYGKVMLSMVGLKMAVGRKRVGFVYGCCLVRAERREEKKKRPADPSNCLVFFNCPLFPKRGGGGGEGG